MEFQEVSVSELEVVEGGNVPAFQPGPPPGDAPWCGTKPHSGVLVNVEM